MRGISNELGLRVMHDVLMNAETSVVACQAFVWRVFFKRFSSIPPFFDGINIAAVERHVAVGNIQGMSQNEVILLITDIARSVSGITETPSADTNLLDLGLDSLGAVEFRNSISDLTGIKLPQSLLFENPTVNDIVLYLIHGSTSLTRKEMTANPVPEETSSSPKKPIDQWLMNSLDSGERYILYIENFTRSYGSLEEMLMEDDIESALQNLGVDDPNDFNSLVLAWNKLLDSSTLPRGPVPNPLLNSSNIIAPVVTTSTRLRKKPDNIIHPVDDVQFLRDQLNFDVSKIEKCTPVNEVRNIFLTGATGFVGRVQLATLIKFIKKRSIKIYCIVRADSKEHARQRIVDACKKAKCWENSFDEHIEALPGNFSKPFFGLAQDEYNNLTKKIDVVYHTGGDVNLLSSYNRIRETNTTSILAVISFCTSIKLKPLHFVSTLGQFPAFFALFNGEFGQQTINEDSQPNMQEMDRLFVPSRQGYPWSKWAAEQILFKAREMGLPLAVYRLPNTYIAYDTGYTNISDYAAALTIAAVREGVFPKSASTAPLTAVDTLCEMLVRVSMKEKRKHWIYHLLDPRLVSSLDLERWNREFGVTYKEVPFDEFYTYVKERGPSSPIYKFAPLMQYWRKYWFDSNGKEGNFPIGNQNIFDELPNMTWPPVQQNYFPKESLAVRVEMDYMISEARLLSGFQNFGDEHFFFEPVKLLSTSLTECDPSFAGKLAIFRTFRQYLMNILYIEEMRCQNPAIEEQTISRPLVIVGLNRSGTTFLQHLLAIDFSNRATKYCEMVTPYGVDGNYRPHGCKNDQESWKDDPRVAHAKEVLDTQLGLSEEWEGIHKQDAMLPEEEFIIFEHCCRSYSICSEFMVPTYRRWLMGNNCAEMKKGYAFHKRFLQHLQWQRRAERWLLKMPFHLFALDALFEAYPDAMIVFMHRDPTETIGSWCSLVKHAQQKLLHSTDPQTIGRIELDTMSYMMNAALQFRKDNPRLQHRFFDVQYEELIAAPMDVVRKIYKYFKLQLKPAFLTKCDNYCMQSRKLREKVVKHTYSLQDVGLDEAMVVNAFDKYYNAGFLKS
ncbi:putative type I fatty acid synthase [Cardiosporidium cionae]|uniref:Type I fatty acid synthase n=1 Tax=Cardiosporidium cionae TaxID=476202 RepID=A0ABQ7JAN0_9APIC|nr:putative type I fatty acid synthase [Cardiosporidium cionae]|eukprot:KAF8821063.1 putative type I fatty acid synthase [Cardiosporidium cionae]